MINIYLSFDNGNRYLSPTTVNSTIPSPSSENSFICFTVTALIINLVIYLISNNFNSEDSALISTISSTALVGLFLLISYCYTEGFIERYTNNSVSSYLRYFLDALYTCMHQFTRENFCIFLDSFCVLFCSIDLISVESDTKNSSTQKKKKNSCCISSRSLCQLCCLLVLGTIGALSLFPLLSGLNLPLLQKALLGALAALAGLSLLTMLLGKLFSFLKKIKIGKIPSKAKPNKKKEVKDKDIEKGKDKKEEEKEALSL